MLLLRLYLRSEIAEMHKNNIRFRMIGDRNALPKSVVELIDHAESTTTQNTGLTLSLGIELWWPPGNCRRCKEAMRSSKCR